MCEYLKEGLGHFHLNVSDMPVGVQRNTFG